MKLQSDYEIISMVAYYVGKNQNERLAQILTDRNISLDGFYFYMFFSYIAKKIKQNNENVFVKDIDEYLSKTIWFVADVIYFLDNIYIDN